MKGKIGLLAYKCAPVASLQLVEEKDMNLMKNQVGYRHILRAASVHGFDIVLQRVPCVAPY
jgi:hypothetical protein